MGGGACAGACSGSSYRYSWDSYMRGGYGYAQPEHRVVLLGFNHSEYWNSISVTVNPGIQLTLSMRAPTFRVQLSSAGRRLMLSLMDRIMVRVRVRVWSGSVRVRVLA